MFVKSIIIFSKDIIFNLLSGFLRYSVSSTNKTDHHDITDILLKVALNTITSTC